VSGDCRGLLHAFALRRKAGDILERIARRDEPPHLMEPETLQREQAHLPVPSMRRIERTPVEPDLLARRMRRQARKNPASHR
jgi:hypothetical protein